MTIVCRSLVALVLTTAMGAADTDRVLAVYKQLEKAAQTGDGNLYVSLLSRKKLAEAQNPKLVDQMRQGFPGDPSVRYEAKAVNARGDRAAVLGRIASPGRPPQYHLVKFIPESGTWKISEELLQSDPIDASALEAAVPPGDGAFARAGSAWDTIRYANVNAKWVQESAVKWKLKSTSDESFLYLRFETNETLPPTGTELPAAGAKSLSGIPPSPDVMVIALSNGKSFSIALAANPMTRATFDETGRATSNRYFVQYSFSLRDAARRVLFSDGTTDTFAPLISVNDRFIDVRLPLGCLGVGKAGAGIEIREANVPAKILPYRVIPFSR